MQPEPATRNRDQAGTGIGLGFQYFAPKRPVDEAEACASEGIARCSGREIDAGELVALIRVEMSSLPCSDLAPANMTDRKNVRMLDAQNIELLLMNYGYFAVLALVTMESAGVPLPGETALIAASVYTGTQHTMDIRLIIAAAAGGAILGDNIGFWVGRRFGRNFLVKYGHYIGVDQRKLDLADYLFMRHGGKIVFFGRFVALLRAMAAVLAGASKFQPARFLVYNAAGGVVWAMLFGSGGYLLGRSVNRFYGPREWITLIIVGIGGFILWRYFKSNEIRLFDEAKLAIKSRKALGHPGRTG